MSETIYTEQQLSIWLRGLLTVAWADGNYDEQEQAAISDIINGLAFKDSEQLLTEPLLPQELLLAFGNDPKMGEDFIKTAVLVSIADGIYSPPEFNLIREFSDTLGLKLEALSSLEETLCQPSTEDPKSPLKGGETQPDLLHPVKDWLDEMEIKDPRLARFLCKMIPSQCPFERDVKLFGGKTVHIPPMCKINPLYDQLVGLRFRALSFLADKCQEDISEYIK
jgi:tellurite resistance protein